MTAQNLPGVVVGRTVTPRRVLRQAGKDREIIVPVILDGTNSYDGQQSSGYEKYIRGGWLLAQDTTSKKWMPVKRTKANAAGAATAALVVDNSYPFNVGDTVIVGTNVGSVVTAIVYSTHTLTLTAAKTWADNDPVYVAGGQGTARAILLDDEVILRTVERNANSDKSATAMILGYVDQDKVLGDVTAVMEDYDSANALKNIIFDDYQDGTDTVPAPFGLFGLNRIQFCPLATHTLTAADNGKLFVVAGAANFTLPAKAAGLSFGFYQTADANLVITSAGSADDIVADGDAAADTVTFSTASHKIGSGGIVTIQPDLVKWLTFNIGATLATVA